jgi:hypothetical protein
VGCVSAGSRVGGMPVGWRLPSLATLRVAGWLLCVCACVLRRSAAAIRELVSTPQFRHQLDLFRWGALALLPSAAAGWLGLAMVGSADSGAAGMALGAA